MAPPRRRFLLRGAVGFAVAITVCIVVGTPSLASGRTEPESCEVGAYVVDVYDLDTKRNTFDAALWIWSVCDNAEQEPLKRMELTNAVETTQSDIQQSQRGSRSWSSVKVIGTFRQSYSLRDFPFDHQTLQIELEDSDLEISEFRFTADTANSALNPKLDPSGWDVTGFRVVDEAHRYVTTFGDPELSSGSGSTYSRFHVQVELSHDAPSLVVKVLGPMYVTFLVAVATFLLLIQNGPSAIGRTGVLGTTLFTVILSMRSANDAMGSPSHLTIMDGLHILTMLYILTAIGLTLRAWVRISAQPEPADGGEIRRLSREGMVGSAAIYVALNIVILFLTVRAG